MAIIYPLLLEDGGAVNLQDDYYLLYQYTVNETYDDFSLYVCGSIDFGNQHDLYIHGVNKDNNFAYLYISGDYNELNNSLNLFVMNDYPKESMTLWIRGGGTAENYVPFNNSAYLYINRPNDVLTMPLICKAADNVTNTYCDLYTVSREGENEFTSLYVSAVSGITNTYSTMFVEGSVVDSGNINMVVPDAHGPENNNVDLFLKQGNIVDTNSMMMYVNGANVVENEMTLTMSNIYAPINYTTSLYIFGWG